MKFHFCGDLTGLEIGLARIADTLKIQCGPDGHKVCAEKSPDGKLYVEKNGDSGVIRYAEPAHFFRGVGIYKEHMEEDRFQIIETPQFRTNGMMLDMCQGNYELNVANMKKFINLMAVMGFNAFYLYMEDTYEVPDEPYFGYLRPRYSIEELKEIDDYAYEMGITVIPCIQTLAHLLDVLKWYPYNDIKEDDDTLLVGEPRTYDFIRHELKAITSAFRSKKIHIGMDEAWKLGQGNYLLKNGYKSIFEIMNEHLTKVLEVCKEFGVEAMIWSDMYLRATNPVGQEDYMQFSGAVSKEIAENAPKDLYYVHWDYGHQDPDFYVALFNRHKEFAEKIVFAGGVWNWNSYAVDYDKTFITSEAALTACKRCGIEDVFITTWGDGGAESNIYQVLLGMQLYAEHGFHETVDEAFLAQRFLACTGCNYNDFRQMTYLDNLFGQQMIDGYNYTNSSRWIMWQDILAGQFDKNIEGLGLGEQYETVYQNMKEAIGRNGDYDFIFEFLSRVANVLRLKAELGIRIKHAYDAGEKEVLRKIATEDLPELRVRVSELRDYNRSLWFQCYKPLGWEVLDIRYGGLLARIDTSIQRICDFVDGKVEALEEVAPERLYFNGKPGLVTCNYYNKIVSASRLSFCMAY